MADIVVHGLAPSPYVRAVLLCLREKRLPYRMPPLRLADLQGEAHLRSNPFARVPIIEYDGFDLYETQAILRFLDAAHPEPRLQPRDLKQAARMDQMIGIVDSYVFPRMSIAISRPRLMGSRVGLTPDEALIAAAVPKARICVRELDRLRGQSRFLVGDGLSLADIMLVPHIDFFSRTPEGVAVLEGTGLAEWLAMMQTRASSQAILPDGALAAA